MPREFIANVDTANEEIERLDSSIATLTLERDQAKASLETGKEKLAQAETDFLAAVADRDAAVKDRDSAKTELEKTQKLLDEANRNVVKAAAAAGGSPLSVPSSEESDARADQSSKLTGTARVAAAIAASSKR